MTKALADRMPVTGQESLREPSRHAISERENLFGLLGCHFGDGALMYNVAAAPNDMVRPHLPRAFVTLVGPGNEDTFSLGVVEPSVAPQEIRTGTGVATRALDDLFRGLEPVPREVYFALPNFGLAITFTDSRRKRWQRLPAVTRGVGERPRHTGGKGNDISIPTQRRQE